MKRYLIILVAVALTLGFATAIAEAVDAKPLLFDWVQILTEVIAWVVRIVSAAILALIGYFGKKYIVPWLEQHRLFSLARELVRAAEAKFGRHEGVAKLEQVLLWMDERGLKTDRDTIIQAVLAAWQELDLQMIDLGIKEHPNQAEQAKA